MKILEKVWYLRMNSKIRVAIIDDGVNQKLIKNIKFDNSYCVKNGKVEIDKSNYNNQLTHGTICAAIISKYNINIDIVSIKILNKSKVGNVDDLSIALNWCANNNINFINISLGSIQIYDYFKLKDSIFKCLDKKIMIIAAKNNNNCFTIPACINGVIGVEKLQKHSLFKIKCIIKNQFYSGIDFHAKGNHKITLSNNKKVMLRSYNSYACAYATAKIILKNSLLEKVFRFKIINFREHLMSLNKSFVYTKDSNVIFKNFLKDDITIVKKTHELDVNKKINLIVLSCDKDIDSWIIKNINKVKNISYMGYINKKIYNILKKSNISLSCLNNYKTGKPLTHDNNCVIIDLFGTDYNIVKYLMSAKKMFGENGYNVEIFTDNVKLCIYGFDYICRKDFKYWQDFYKKIYNPDLIFRYCDKLNNTLSPDYYLTIDNKDCKLLNLNNKVVAKGPSDILKFLID